MIAEPRINKVHDPRCKPSPNQPHYQRVVRIDERRGPILQCITCGKVQEPKTGTLR